MSRATNVLLADLTSITNEFSLTGELRRTFGSRTYPVGYGYDALGQVTSGKKYWTDGTPVPGQQFEYGFDDIGNRTSTKAGGDQSGAGLRPASYSANSLNQYTNRTVPGAFDVMGIANASASVTINSSAADYRRGEYFQELVSVNNSSTSVWQNVSVTTSGGGTNTGNVFVPAATETFAYDADGNMTNDGRWTFTWDAENRLVSMQALSSVPNGAKKKLDFTYDYGGRRIQKIVSTWNGSAYVAASTNKFLYDAWNLITELNGTNGVIRSYFWGTDLSDGMQGAGGVGGLLAIKPTATNTLFVAYDGNGNVTGLIDATTGTISGQFEYGSFGETIRLTPNANNQSPFRFSTKYTDDESDSLYYGFRYYNPSTGRWLSRDPIEERGRLNLYGFVSNDPIGLIDLLGEAVLPPGFVGPPNVDDFYGTAIPDPKTPDAARVDRERFGRGIMNQFADLQRLNPDKCCKLDPCSLAAQWMAESNWGRSGLAIDAKNLGGIKGRGPAGSYNAKTREFEGETQVQIRDNFRAYHNYPEFYADYANLICKADRYKNARGKKGREYYEALKRGGYSTDPKYTDKMMQFYRQLGCK